MMTFFSISGIGLMIVAAFYFLVILVITIGLYTTRRLKKSGNLSEIKVSIIIPARDEEQNILKCLNDIKNQDYPSRFMEIVVVDDQSTDKTCEVVQNFSSSNPSVNLRLIRNICSCKDQAFKKHCISEGVEATTGELIITTDADTRSNPGWISGIVDLYLNKHPQMIIGPVAFKGALSVFEKMQIIEFSGLMAGTAGSAETGFPLMCNGANLTFQREAWLKIQDLPGDFKYPSGDDMFLMMKIRKKYDNKSVKFLFSSDGVIYTSPKRTISEFINQRVRWVSKSRGYKHPVVLGVSILTWLFNVLILFGFCAGIFDRSLMLISIYLFICKIIIEMPVLWRITTITGGRKFLYLYPVVQFLNLFYVSTIGFLGNFLSYEWKGRIINPSGKNG